MAAVFSCFSVAVLFTIVCLHIGCFAITVRPAAGNYSPTCVPTIEDHQQFYTKETVTGEIEHYWIELQDQSKHIRLSNSTGGFDRMNLTFGFPFYGQTIKHVYLTTKGVLSMSPDLETVPVSHFIYPYIAHFNPSLSENSAVYIDNTDDKFIVEWRNIFLEIGNETTAGPYHFQMIAHRNGSILFLYKEIPSVHYFNGTLAGLGSGIDIFKTDCELARDSQTCISDRFLFYCKKCRVIKQCSDEIDRQVRQWLRTNCKHETPGNCKADKHKSSSKTVAIVVIIAVVVVLISLLGGWIYYAYKHPTTPSGRWLIEHRPSQWLGLYRSRKGSSTDDQDRTSQEHEDDDSGY